MCFLVLSCLVLQLDDAEIDSWYTEEMCGKFENSTKKAQKSARKEPSSSVLRSSLLMHEKFPLDDHICQARLGTNVAGKTQPCK